MNTSTLSGRLATALALVGFAAPGFAQVNFCVRGAPNCAEGQPTQLPPFVDTFTSPVFPINISLEVPKYTGAETLVGVALKFELSTIGEVSYTNDTTASCFNVTWSHVTNIGPIASPDAPLCPSFPINVPPIDRSGTFAFTPSGGTSVEVLNPDGYCDVCPISPAITVGPLVDAANLAAFTGPGTVEFTSSASAVSGCLGACTPGQCAFDVSLVASVRVIYYVCAEEPPESGCVCNGPSPHYREPGSLLLFPEFDNLPGDLTVITVTNADCTQRSGDTIIEYIYINKDTCGEFNRTETLTPCDTLTLLTTVHNPGQQQGYLYVFAKDADDNAIVSNNLIGNLLVISGFNSFDYSINPVAFKGIGNAIGTIQPQGAHTDLDNDGLLDLDGREYEPAPDSITIPRFLGQDDMPGPGLFQSQLIMINLSGGAAFDETVLDCLIYNDNEIAFSFTPTFDCWEKSYLRDLSLGFANEFLKQEDDPAEIVGAPQRESGWICCDGLVANSITEEILDPAFYMVLVERVGNFGVADLPFECGFQTNGTLLPRANNGDGDIDSTGDGIPDPQPDDNM